MAMHYQKHFENASRVALEDGTSEDIAAGRIGRFEALFAMNPDIPKRLEEAGLLAAACNRIALGAKFHLIDVDERLAQGDLDHHQRNEVKLCLMNVGLME